MDVMNTHCFINKSLNVVNNEKTEWITTLQNGPTN